MQQKFGQNPIFLADHIPQLLKENKTSKLFKGKTNSPKNFNFWELY